MYNELVERLIESIESREENRIKEINLIDRYLQRLSRKSNFRYKKEKQQDKKYRI